MALASFPWYDLPELHDATNGLWEAISTRLTEAGFDEIPNGLERTIDHNRILMRPDLVLSQTCGYVAVGRGHSIVQLVATPCYDAPGCRGSGYRSFVLTRKPLGVSNVEDLRGLRCSVNEPLSHSGVNPIRQLVAPLHEGGRFFSSVQLSGSHIASLEALAGDDADVASIDCITWELVRRNRPELLDRTTVFVESDLSPAPPFVTRVECPPERVALLQRVLDDVLNDPACDRIHEQLLLRAIELIPLDDYECMLFTERNALEAGYEELSWPDYRLAAE